MKLVIPLNSDLANCGVLWCNILDKNRSLGKMLGSGFKGSEVQRFPRSHALRGNELIVSVSGLKQQCHDLVAPAFFSLVQCLIRFGDQGLGGGIITGHESGNAKTDSDISTRG